MFLRCSARYTGRIDAELELGDRLLIVKDDGTAILHAATGLQPKNWMPAGSTLEMDGMNMSFIHERRGERLDVYVDHVHSDNLMDAKMHGRLIKLGSEREFSDLISQSLHLVCSGLELVGREVRTAVGPVDILARDRDGTYVVIEVKRARVTAVEVAYQLLRYLDAFMASPQTADLRVRGLLVAPGFSRPLSAALTERNLGAVRLSYADVAQLSNERTDEA